MDQFKEFVERRHKRTMTNLVAFLDMERIPGGVSAPRARLALSGSDHIQ